VHRRICTVIGRPRFTISEARITEINLKNAQDCSLQLSDIIHLSINLLLSEGEHWMNVGVDMMLRAAVKATVSVYSTGVPKKPEKLESCLAATKGSTNKAGHNAGGDQKSAEFLEKKAEDNECKKQAEERRKVNQAARIEREREAAANRKKELEER
jgi:hypothetical protein